MSEKKIEIGGRLHSIATGNVLAGANEIFDDDKNKKQSDINTETYSLVNDVNERLNGLSPDQQSALSVAAKATNNETKLGYYVCDTEGNVVAKVIANATGYVLSTGGSIKVKMTNANTVANATLNINSTGAKPLYYDGERASANNSWEAGETVEVYYDGTNFYANNVAGGGGDGVFDVSEKYPTSGVEGGNTYTLEGALTVLNANLPASKKKGGMSIKFVQSSDNNYVQFRYMGTSTANADFTNVANWQGVDEEPISGSKNLISSGGVANVVGIINPFEYIRHNNTQYLPSETGNRYSVLFNVMPGDTIVAESNWGSGLFADIWQDRNSALVGGSRNMIQTIRDNYSTAKITGVANYSGVLRIGTKKLDDSAFTQADIDAFIASFTYTIVKKDSLQGQINKEVEARMLLPTSTSFMAIYTSGYFNANNTTQKVEIPAFNCWVNGQVLDFSAQQIDYYWVNNSSSRQWFALVLSDDLTSIEMIEWTGIVNKKNIIAFIARPNYSTTNVNMFYGCNSDSQKESIWRINGLVFDRSKVYCSIQRGYPLSNKIYGVLNNGTHLCFPAKAGDTVNVRTGQYYTYICYVKTYPYPVAGKAIDYSSAEGYTDRIEIEAGQNYTGTVPSDANFVIVAYGNDTYANLDVQMVAVNRVVYLKWGIINNIEERQNNLDNSIEAINETIGSNSTVITSSDGFPYKRRQQVSSAVESATGNRYTIGIDLKAGDTIKVKSTYSPGIYVAGFDSFDACCLSADGRALQEYYSSYTTNEVIGTVNVDQVFSIRWKNSDNSAITDAQIEQMLASLTVEVVRLGTGLAGDVETLKEQVQEIINNPTDSSSVESDKKLLYIGSLVQKSVSGNTFTDSSVVVTQRCALAVPYYNAIVGIKLPAGYSIGFKTGYSTTGISLTWVVDSGLLSNGDSYTFDGHNGQVYRVYFKKSNGADITVEEVNGLIASGAIQLTYLSPDGSIVTRNSHTESYVKGLMRKFTGTLANDDSLHKMPVFTHLSDIHGDAVRYENFVEYSDAIEADAALVSGDLVPMCGAQDFTDYIDDIADKYNVMLLPCMGNHDARNNTTEQLQNAVLAHSIQKYELQTPAGKTYPTYYYKDIASQSIRIIALNLYCAGQKSTNDWRLTQDQMTWFVNTLASTPAGYGVIVMMHSPETTTTKDNDHSKFYQKFDTGAIDYNNSYLPIRKIIDAFISKTTFSGTFDEKITGSVTESITISADFTSVDASTEFICYVTGHRHHDCIGYVNGATNMQLMCNIALGFSLYGDSNYHYYAEETDVPRGGKGFVQDLMNVYVVDRATGNLRIARVGSNMNQDFEMRDYMTIPYKAS